LASTPKPGPSPGFRFPARQSVLPAAPVLDRATGLVVALRQPRCLGQRTPGSGL